MPFNEAFHLRCTPSAIPCPLLLKSIPSEHHQNTGHLYQLFIYTKHGSALTSTHIHPSSCCAKSLDKYSITTTSVGQPLGPSTNSTGSTRSSEPLDSPSVSAASKPGPIHQRPRDLAALTTSLEHCPTSRRAICILPSHVAPHVPLHHSPHDHRCTHQVTHRLAAALT